MYETDTGLGKAKKIEELMKEPIELHLTVAKLTAENAEFKERLQRCVNPKNRRTGSIPPPPLLA